MKKSNIQKSKVDHFPTPEAAMEYAIKHKEWWGDNLVILPVKEEDDGTFSPQFNVWN
jgi:hypothetical protein